MGPECQSRIMARGDRWFFDRMHPIYDLVMPAAREEALQAGLAHADGPIDHVIDLGGGTGRASRAITEPDRVVVDLSAGMLKRVPAEIGRILGSATELPIAGGVIDAVIVVDALHHFPDHERAITEAFRVLRPGGVVVVRDFNRATLRGRLLMIAEHAIRMESTFHTPTELVQKLDAVGFAAEAIASGFSYTVVGRKP